METRERPPLVKVGTVIDGTYRIESLIGMGAYSQVYKAKRVDRDEAVAIKLADIDLDGPDAADLSSRFLWEAEMAAQLTDHCFVTVYDVGMLKNGVLYMVREYLRGLTLADHRERLGAFAVQRAVRLVVPLLRAVAKAHAEAIVSRELIPSNLFLRSAATDDERICVIDFSLATQKGNDEGGVDRTSFASDIARYLPPEFFRESKVSAALDVYQLGLVLVEMTSGRPAVAGSNEAECRELHLSGELHIPGGLLASSVGPVLLRALDLDSELRFQDAGEFAAALEKAAESLPAEDLWITDTDALRDKEPSGLHGLPTNDEAPVVRAHPIAEIRRRAEIMRRTAESGELAKVQTGDKPAGAYWDVDVNIPPSEEMDVLHRDSDPEPFVPVRQRTTVEVHTHELTLDDIEFEEE